MTLKPYSSDERKQIIGQFFHFYQPERRGHIGPSVRLPELGSSGVHFRLLSEVNYKIATESYLPFFLRRDMDRVLHHSCITFFPSLRYWFEKAYPEGQLSGWSSFNTMLQTRIKNMPDGEYHVLSGPPIHIILPLLPDDDIRMVLEMTRQIDSQDFGFTPKGLFCPEMAVDARVLKAAAEVGYEYVPLRDYQVDINDKTKQYPDGRVDSINNVVYVEFPDGRHIATILVDTFLSGQYAFNRQATTNADQFLDSLKQHMDSNKLSAIDGETIGHHIQYLDLFFARMHEVMEDKGFLQLDVRRLLSSPEKNYASVKPTSWSCAHGFGRWTGECDCDNPPHEVRHNKYVFTKKLRHYNDHINLRLDAIKPGWRGEFKELFTKLRKKILTGDNYVPDLEEAIGDQNYLRYMTTKFAIMVGFTSCGTFFAHKNQVEKRIPKACIQAVELLLPEEKIKFRLANPDLIELDDNTGQQISAEPQYEFL